MPHFIAALAPYAAAGLIVSIAICVVATFVIVWRANGSDHLSRNDQAPTGRQPSSPPGVGPRQARPHGRRAVLVWGAVAAACLGVPAALLARHLAMGDNGTTATAEGVVRKLSRKGWVCKTWEGELVVGSTPSGTANVLRFTVPEAFVAGELKARLGEAVAVSYMQRTKRVSSCFGDTDNFVNDVLAAPEVPVD